MADSLLDNAMASAAAGVSNGLGAVLQGVLQSKDIKKAYKYNRAMMQEQYQMNLEQWNRQNAYNEERWNVANEYNSPSAQMQRLKEAGLNPNLVYGNGVAGATGNNSGPTSAGNSPQLHYPQLMAYQGGYNLDRAFSQVLNGALSVAQIKKTEQETSNLASSQKVTQMEEKIAFQRLIASQYANAKTEQEREFWKDMARSNLLNTQSSTANLNSQISYRDFFQSPLASAQTDLADRQTEFTKQNTLSNIAERSLIVYRKELMHASAVNALASAGLSSQKADNLAYELVNNLPSLNENIKASTEEKNNENIIREMMINSGLDPRDHTLVGKIANIFIRLKRQFHY